MTSRFVVATLFCLLALPLVCAGQDQDAADPEDAIIRLDPNDPSLDPRSRLRDTAEDAERGYLNPLTVDDERSDP